MKKTIQGEFRVVGEGEFRNENEARSALLEPFIEDWVERTGSYRVHQLGEIKVTNSVTLGDLAIKQLEPNLFAVYSNSPAHPLNEKRARQLAEALERQLIFSVVRHEPVPDEEVEIYKS